MCALCIFSGVLFIDEFNQILARKELNFEKMSDRDRKQIVAEVYAHSMFPRLSHYIYVH